jgi:exopolyphosphatase/pppGpp-phosphohydrolase
MSSTLGASIDIGSNSVHLLVARVADHQVEPLADESVFLGLGAAVATHGLLGPDARAGLIDALRTYVDTARTLGTEAVTLVGTEPLRRAGDGRTLVHEVEAALGLPLHVLTHEEEALLTVVGVMEGRPVAHETLVVDLGGGSSEFCVVGPDGRPRAAGLRLGSARLTERFARHDPPTAEEMVEMLVEARRLVDQAPDARPREIVAVGGTASNLIKVVRFGRSRRVLTRDGTAKALALLAAEPAELSARRHAIKPERARILPAGAVIVDAILRRYRVDSMRVSEAGIREGAILAEAHVGMAWRDRLADLAHGWRI